MIKSVFKPVKQDFDVLTDHIDELMSQVDIEAETAEKCEAVRHRNHVEAELECQYSSSLPAVITTEYDYQLRNTETSSDGSIR